MAIGVSFVPSQPPAAGTDARTVNTANPAVQQAIQTLSLRLPRVVGSQALAPSALLHGAGSAGLSGSGSVDAIVQSVLKRMLPQAGSQTTQPAPAAPGMPQAPAVSGAQTGAPVLAGMPAPAASAPSASVASSQPVPVAPLPQQPRPWTPPVTPTPNVRPGTGGDQNTLDRSPVLPANPMPIGIPAPKNVDQALMSILGFQGR